MAIDPLNPNFESRYRLVQPETSRPRIPYRSPISSEANALFMNATVNDITNLYLSISSIKNDIDEKFDQLFNSGFLINGSEHVNSIEESSTEILKLKSRIQTLSE